MGVNARLSAMMFLQYACSGAYAPILTLYMMDQLGFSSREVGLVSVASAIGALSAPFIQGQIADRHFPTQKALAFSHFVAGILCFVWSWQQTFLPFLVLSVVYAVIYVPTFALTNSICFHNVKDGKRDFPLIRVWGTIGWIAVAWFYSTLWLEGKKGDELRAAYAGALQLSGAISVLLAGFCLWLPHTPPQEKATERYAWVAALKLLKNPPFLVIFLISLPGIIIHGFFFFWAGKFLKDAGVEDAWVPRYLSIGQISEILLMLLVPLALARKGFKFTLAIGLLAYALRFAAFAIGSPLWMVISSIALHGVCFGFFLAVVYIFVDHCAAADIRASAQSLIGIIVLGIGPLLGNPFAGELGEWYKVPGTDTYRYPEMFWIATGMSLATLVAFLVFFRPHEREPAAADAPTGASPAQ
jgi:nucleoside transporter